MQRLQQDLVCQGPCFNPGILLHSLFLTDVSCRRRHILMTSPPSPDQSRLRWRVHRPHDRRLHHLRHLRRHPQVRLLHEVFCNELPRNRRKRKFFSRRMGESDDCINRLAKKDGIIDKKFWVYWRPILLIIEIHQFNDVLMIFTKGNISSIILMGGLWHSDRRPTKVGRIYVIAIGVSVYQLSTKGSHHFKKRGFYEKLSQNVLQTDPTSWPNMY